MSLLCLCSMLARQLQSKNEVSATPHWLIHPAERQRVLSGELGALLAFRAGACLQTSSCPSPAALRSILSNASLPQVSTGRQIFSQVEAMRHGVSKGGSQKVSTPLCLGFQAHLPEHLALAKSDTSNIQQQGSLEPN